MQSPGMNLDNKLFVDIYFIYIYIYIYMPNFENDCRKQDPHYT